MYQNIGIQQTLALTTSVTQPYTAYLEDLQCVEAFGTVLNKIDA